MNGYERILERRRQLGGEHGFSPEWMPGFLFDFQSHLVDWAVRKGRGAIFADCGMGKTPMQLVWAENVARRTDKPVLIATPLAVAHQTEREAEKFGLDAKVSRDGCINSRIVITNYERLHYFNASDFGGMAGDESSAIKAYDSQRKADVTDFMRLMEHRLLCTATAAPNDFIELGTSSEALGYLGYRDMITTFFTQLTERDELGWGRTKYRLKGHAAHPFWRWVCSWARAIRKPSDLGYSDERFDLPPLSTTEHLIENSTPRQGMLFSTPARGLREQREERRVTIQERCEKAAELASGSDPVVVWCHLNDEGDLLSQLIPDGEQVSGSMSDEAKESRLEAFGDGELRVLIIKPKIGAWGLNWQHCNRVVMFPSHSFEQYYQSIRRCWRFGQERPVSVDIITTEGEAGVLKNLQRKAEQAEGMFESLVSHMRDELAIELTDDFPRGEELPIWLARTSA